MNCQMKVLLEVLKYPFQLETMVLSFFEVFPSDPILCGMVLCCGPYLLYYTFI